MATQFDEYGITIYPKGSALEQVHHREREMSLIAAGDGTEVVHIRLQAKASWVMGLMVDRVRESVRFKRLYQTTGTSIPHSYVWVTVNGTPILALDPPKPVIK